MGLSCSSVCLPFRNETLDLIPGIEIMRACTNTHGCTDAHMHGRDKQHNSRTLCPKETLEDGEQT